jgi:hypothetical protein
LLPLALGEEDFGMSELGTNEIAIRRDLFNALVDELTDAIGWLLVIREENPAALQRACGHLDADDRLMQMSAVLGGRTLDKRHSVAEAAARGGEDSSPDGQGYSTESSPDPCEGSSPAGDGSTGNQDFWKRDVEERKDEDSRNTMG